MKKDKYSELYIKGENPGASIERLAGIIKVLRKECPWDKVQTHQTLTTCMLEEAYETVDAIKKQDTDNLREELGDVLLQVVFHCDLSEEELSFNLTDVINEECEKMIRRHPHVFLEDNIKTIDKTLEKWENIKSKEHGDLTYAEGMYKVPDALPALMRSSKIQSKASRIGFDWDNIEGPFEKVEEELEELRIAYSAGDFNSMSEELGDLLFSVVNVSRFMSIDPEEALNESVNKFIKRFAFIESMSIEKGVSLENMTLDEMDELWTESKNNGNHK